MGLAVNMGSTCAVAAAREIIEHRRATIWPGFGVAIGVAALVTLSLKWLFGDAIHLAGDTGISGDLLLGAFIMGIGATINGACLFGTLGRIGRGEYRFLALPVGLAIGFVGAANQSLLTAQPAMPSPLTQPSFFGIAAIAAFVALVILASRHLGPTPAPDAPESALSLRAAMALLGGFGALQHAIAPGWTYADVIGTAVRNPLADFNPWFMVAILAALAGATIAGVRAGLYKPSWPDGQGIGRSLLGGALMGFGGSLIPGGNDTVLLSLLPAATVGGLIAYVTLSATVILILMATNARKTRLSV